MNIPLARFTNCASTLAPVATRGLAQSVSLLAVAVAFFSAFSDVRAEVLFEGKPEPGPFTINFAQSSDAGLDVDTTGSVQAWQGFLYSVPPHIIFSPSKRYRVSWDFEVQKNKNPETFFYYFFKSSADETSRRGFGKWVAKDGESGHMEVTATLGDFYGYVFALGCAKGGAITIKNLKIEEVPPRKLDKGYLYQPPFENDEGLGLVLSPEGRTVKGGFEMDTTTGREWNYIFSTSPAVLPLQTGHTYRVAFNYDVKSVSEKGDNFMVCHLKKSDGSNSSNMEHWNSWPVSAGDSGHKEFNFTVTEPDCSIRLGDHNGISVRIEDFTIEDLSQQ
jgi:hypothetical protein